MNIVLLVAISANHSKALKVGVWTMAIGAVEAIMIALQFKETKVMNFSAVFNGEAVEIVAAFAVLTIGAFVNILMAVGAVGSSEILLGNGNLVILEQMLWVTFLAGEF